MKTKIVGKFFLSLSVMLVLVERDHTNAWRQPGNPGCDYQYTGDVTRGEIGSFVLDMKPAIPLGGAYVNFSVRGTAVPWLDLRFPLSPRPTSGLPATK